MGTTPLKGQACLFLAAAPDCPYNGVQEITGPIEQITECNNDSIIRFLPVVFDPVTEVGKFLFLLSSLVLGKLQQTETK